MKKLVSFLFAVFGGVQCCFAAVNATDIYLLAQTNNTSELSKIRNIDATDLYGDTALCSAIRFNDIDAYNLLKNFGANTEHRCTKKILREHYSSFIQKVAEANKSWTFLGMGKWTWGAIGVGVAGGAAAIAMSGGGGKNADNPLSSPSNTLDCVHGVQINNRCSCDNGWTGTLCDIITTCPYSTISCASGYIETGNTCQSGNTMYKECIPSTCPYSTTSCSAGYYETGETCKSGENTYVKCQANACEGYNYTDTNACPPGYTISDTCLSGNISKYKCETPAICSYTTTECTEGYSETGNTCKSGENLYKECVPSTCPYSTTSCGTGFYATGNSCLSGGTTYIECEFDSDNYINQEGTIYQKLNCVHGNQIANSCSCADGWTGDLCDTVSTCPYTTTSCRELGGAYQATGNTCKSGDNVYEECEPIQCGTHATWSSTGCICDSGYGNWQRGTGCFDTSNCGNHAYNDGDNCVCEPGYKEWRLSDDFVGCIRKSDAKIINNTTSEQDIYGEYNASTHYLEININNSTNSNVHGIFDNEPLSSINHSGTIYITNGGNGDVYGIKHINKQENDTSNSGNFANGAYSNDKIIISNNGDGDVFGIYSEIDQNYNGYIGTTSNLSPTYYDRTHSGNNFYSQSTIDINNLGDGNVYGMYGQSLKNTTVSLYSSSGDFTDYFRGISGKINIINDGIGNSYGMYVTGGNSVQYAANATYGSGYITIQNQNSGNAYGIFAGATPTYNSKDSFSQVRANGYINITNNATGNVYGMYGQTLYNVHGARKNGNESGDDFGNILISNNNSGNAYGMFGTSENSEVINASGYGSGTISIWNKGAGNAYGMFGPNIASVKTFNSSHASIDLVNYESGNSYGMYGTGNVYNGISGLMHDTSSKINIQNLINGKSIGIYAEGGIADNSGEININNIGTGIAIGIFGDMNSTITNTGIINITRNDYVDKDSVLHDVSGIAGDVFGIYAKSGSVVNNFGNITITSNGNAYGIYAESDSTVTNTGTISINGESCSGTDCNTGNYIVLNGSTLYNSGVVVAPQMNLNSMDGKVMAGLGSQFVIDNELSGDLNISSELVQNGNQTTYIAENMIDAGDVSGLNVRSASAMFDASLADNGHDVVMHMKDFNELTDNKSLAAFLKNNYDNGNGAELFSTLKSMDNMSAFNSTLSGLTGLNTFTQFAHEDLSAMREISFSMNNKLFENSGRDSFDISDSTGYFSFSNDHNGGSGRYGISSDKISDNWKLGYGMAMANINTGDGNDMHRQNNLWLFYMPATYTNDDIELVIAPKAGFAHSEYNRRGYNNINYDGYIEKRIFGFMNDLRYSLTFGNWTFAPDLAFNTIVYEQSGREDEQAFSLIIPDDRTVSVESGLGLYTKYEKTLQDGSRFKLNSGLMVYREFGDTYDIKLGMRGMDGTFSLYNNDYEYRSAASLGFDYTAGHLHLYGNAQYFMDNDNYMNFKGGISYRF